MNSHDLKENLNNFFSSYAFYIALGVVILIAIAIVLIFVLSRRKNKTKINKQDVVIDTNEWLAALGGKDNIIEKEARGSRLVLKLNDPEKIDESKLKELGVSNIMKMSNKITLVFEDQAEAILSQLE